jgi:putative hemolysin
LPQQRVLRSIAQPLAAAVVTDVGLLLTAVNGTLMAVGQVTCQVPSPSGQVLSPTAEPQNKADKLVQLLNSLSKSCASQGSRGALEERRLIGALSVVELRSTIAARGLPTSWAASILSSNASFVFGRIVLRL